MRKQRKRWREAHLFVLVSALILIVGGSWFAPVSAEESEEHSGLLSDPGEQELLPLASPYFEGHFKSYLAQRWDQNKDGYLSKEERERATYVQMDPLMGSKQKYIVDFKGLEYLPNIDDIVIGRSDGMGGIPVVKNLDLSQRNMLIISLHGALMSGETLDLRKSTKATFIKLDSSELANVLLPEEAPHLKYLNVYGIPLKTINAVSYPNLETLLAFQTAIDTLNLENNVYMKNLGVGSANLKQLNVSLLTELEQLDISDSPIKKLDLSSNEKLTRLTVYDTEIQSVDLTNLKRLERVTLQGNHLSKLDLSNQPDLNVVGLNYQMRAPWFDGIPSERIQGVVKQDAATQQWQVDFCQWMAADQLGRVSMKEYTEEEWAYDQQTGIATYLSEGKPAFLDYKYETFSVKTDNWSKNTAMYIRANLAEGYLISAHAGTGGTVTPDGVKGYETGSQPVYQVTPKEGYALDQVTVNGAAVELGASHQYTFPPLEQDASLEVTFKELPIINASAAAGGTISPAGRQWYDFGSEATYQIQPATGYKIAKVEVDGKVMVLGEALSYTFKDIQKDHTIQVVFEEKSKQPTLVITKEISREISEYEAYLTLNPSGSLTEYVRPLLTIESFYCYEEETTRHAVDDTEIDFQPALPEEIQAGTYAGSVRFPSSWSGPPVEEQFVLHLTKASESSSEFDDSSTQHTTTGPEATQSTDTGTNESTTEMNSSKESTTERKKGEQSRQKDSELTVWSTTSALPTTGSPKSGLPTTGTQMNRLSLVMTGWGLVGVGLWVLIRKK